MTTTAADCACSPHATAGHCRLPVPTGLPIPPSRCWTLHSPPRPAPEPCLHHRVGSRRPPISRSAPWPPPENSMTAGAAPAPLPARVQSNKVCASATRHALANLVRGKLRAALAKQRPDLLIPEAVWRKPWVVHCTAWGNGADAVLEYLARYVYRVAITNSRIIGLNAAGVTI